MSPAVLPRLQAQVAAEADLYAGFAPELGYRSVYKTSLEDGVVIHTALWQDDATDSIAILVWTVQTDRDHGANSSYQAALATQLHHYCVQVYEVNLANAPDTSLDTFAVTSPYLAGCLADAAPLEKLFRLQSLTSLKQLQRASKNVLIDGSSCCTALLLPDSYTVSLPALLAVDSASVNPRSLLPPLDEYHQASQPDRTTFADVVGMATNVQELARQAKGCIMVSYSWGKQAADGSYPQQETAKAVKV
jgi:hypothetical protein